jgi:hypothetical protein
VTRSITTRFVGKRTARPAPQRRPTSEPVGALDQIKKPVSPGCRWSSRFLASARAAIVGQHYPTKVLTGGIGSGIGAGARAASMSVMTDCASS